MSKTKKKVVVLRKEVFARTTGTRPLSGCSRETEYADLDTARRAMRDEALDEMAYIAKKYSTHTSEFTENTCKISNPCYVHSYTVKEEERDCNFTEAVCSALLDLSDIVEYACCRNYNEAASKAGNIKDVLLSLLNEVEQS